MIRKAKAVWRGTGRAGSGNLSTDSGVLAETPYSFRDRIYTVMSGVFYIGLGDQFDGDKVKAYPPGSVIVLPGNTSHFHWAKAGEYVTQVSAIGPLGLEYLDPDDDPREQNRQ